MAYFTAQAEMQQKSAIDSLSRIVDDRRTVGSGVKLPGLVTRREAGVELWSGYVGVVELGSRWPFFTLILVLIVPNFQNGSTVSH
jgi:hypothetical protein